MKTDFSLLILQKYFTLKSKKVIINLKNKELVKGFIIGYFKGEENFDDTEIYKWHIVSIENKILFPIDAFGLETGIFVLQKDITEIQFLEDNSTIKIR
jgi:hypothetical protein